jgi:hypothetical protein
VTVQTKSAWASQACREDEQHHSIVCKRGCDRFPFADVSSGNAAPRRKKPMETGVTVTTANLTDLPGACRGRQFRV